MSLDNLGRQIVAPLGIAVVGIALVAWYVTLTSADAMMSLTMTPLALGPAELVLFFILIVTMMIAMMLPATLPMLLGYRQILESKETSAGLGPNAGTVAFMAPYVVVWGGFGVLTLLGLAAWGLVGPMTDSVSFASGLTLVAAGAYQASSLKKACLRQCQSPLTFIFGRWRKGLSGALRMGLSHSMYCLGCCWLFMVALFVTGAMSLLWMGAVSLMIFVEKVGITRRFVSRGIGVLLVLLGLLVVLQASATI